MSAELNAIVNAYEQEGLNPEQIAEDRDLDIASVKAALMQGSSRYRKACNKENENIDELNFSDDQLARVNQILLDLALGADDEHLRFKAASYVRDDKKGRKEIAKGMAGNSFNILYINQQMAKVRAMTDGIKRAVLDNGEQKREIVNV